jgi:hypothetical protein
MTWIALSAFVLPGAACLTLLVRKNAAKQRDERDPEQPRNVERGRAHSEAEAAKDVPLSEAEEEDAAELVAFLDKIGTGEQLLVLAFDADPLSAPIPEDRSYAEPDLWNDVTASWLSRFTWTLPTEPAVPFSSVQVSEPAPLDVESFTTGWTRAEIAEILAKGKAGAR